MKRLLLISLVTLSALTALAATRGVVAELFTASWCTYCPYADAALGQLADEKGLDNFCPVAWHSSSSDPFYTSEAAARMAYLGNIPGYPTCVFDASLWIVGGSSSTYSTYSANYDIRRMFESPCTIDFLSKSYSGDKASVSVKVKLEKNIAANSRVMIVLWEDKIYYNGRDYRFVERSQATPITLSITGAGQEEVCKAEFTLNAGWEKSQLGVTVYVENTNPKEIYQGRASKLVEGVAVLPASLGKVKALYQ